MKKLLVALLLYLCNLMAVNAALVGVDDHDTYLTDTTSGLDWLDVTATTGMSYNDVSAQLGIGGAFEGWRIATAAELGALLSNSGVTSYIDDVSQGVMAHAGDASPSLDGSSLQELINLLGVTLFYVEGMTGYSATHTWGLIDNVYPTASAPSHYVAKLSIYAGLYDVSFSVNTGEPALDSAGDNNIGSYLIRNHATVPEPPAIALLLLGLLVLGRAYRRIT